MTVVSEPAGHMDVEDLKRSREWHSGFMPLLELGSGLLMFLNLKPAALLTRGFQDLVGLALWVDHYGPPPRTRLDNSVSY